MAGRWMDDRDPMRERDWRRQDSYQRDGDDYRGMRGGEERSFGSRPRGQDRVFGERETGADYNRGGDAGRGEYGGYRGRPVYGRGGGREHMSGSGPASGGYGSGRPAWQDRDYEGVSPGFSAEDDDFGYGGGYGRGYGQRDDFRRLGSRAYGRPYGGRRYGVAGGTGGYDYERGYGDGGRGDDRDRDRSDRFEDAGRSAGEFLHRAGERVASWFGGEDRDGYGPDRRERSHRGLGPKGYKRSDERINEEAHERLTDDLWLDASNISISVSSGEVTLSGTVETREAKHRAERLVEDLSGVNHVQNNLRIARGGFLTSPTSGYGDSVLDAQMRDDPGSSGTGGSGSGQSPAGRKS